MGNLVVQGVGTHVLLELCYPKKNSVSDGIKTSRILAICNIVYACRACVMVVHKVRYGPLSAGRPVLEQQLLPAGCSLRSHVQVSMSTVVTRAHWAGLGCKLTLDKLCAVWAMCELLLKGVAAGSVGVGDGGLVDLGLADRGVGVLVSHVVVVTCWWVACSYAGSLVWSGAVRCDAM